MALPDSVTLFQNLPHDRLQMGGAGVRFGADAVDLQAVVIVHREGFAGHVPQNFRLHPGHEGRQGDNPAVQACRRSDQFDQLLQRIDIRAAQVDGLRIGLAVT